MRFKSCLTPAAAAWLCLLTLMSPAAPRAASGSLDTTFSHDGKATASLDSADMLGRDVLVYRGRTLAAGYVGTGDESSFALARWLGNGELDSDFGGDGTVITAWSPGSADASRLSRYDRWRVLAAGPADPNPEPSSASRLAIARYRWDGELDQGFDGDGKLLTEVAGEYGQTLVSSVDDIRVRKDGKILVAALTESVAGPGDHRSLAVVVRYHPDGSLDTTFGEGGFVTAAPIAFKIGDHGERETQIHSVRLLPNGGFVAAGMLGAEHCCSHPLALARYKADGSFDPTFDDDGRARMARGFEQGDEFHVSDIEIDADQNIVLGGTFDQAFGCNPCVFRLQRFTAEGSPDKTFGEDGAVLTQRGDWDSHLSSLVLQPDGKIVATGTTSREVQEGLEAVFQTTRYKDSGALDKSFSGDGIIRTGFAPRSAALGNSSAGTIDLHPRGRIVVVGSLRPNEKDSFTAQFAVARYVR